MLSVASGDRRARHAPETLTQYRDIPCCRKFKIDFSVHPDPPMKIDHPDRKQAFLEPI
jgi:hypothetical protein